MRYYTVRVLLSLILLLSCGCASRQDGGESSKGETDAVLRYEGQEICLDTVTGRMWQVERSELFSSFQQAAQYAEDLTLAGYDDWRLPTRKEMFDLHYIFFWEKNGNCTMKTIGDYWTASELGEEPPGHWETYYLCGPESKYTESLGASGHVRAVRP